METLPSDIASRENERPEVTMRRFNRVVQESGLARFVKLNRYFTRKHTRRAIRLSAQRKAATRASRRGY